jgi:hypothetical protein
LKNGAIAGGIVGGAAMVCVVAWAIQLADEGQGVSRRDVLTATRFTALAAAGGALVGAGIDRAIDGRRTLYAAPGGTSVRVRPLAAPGRIGVSVRAGW